MYSKYVIVHKHKYSLNSTYWRGVCNAILYTTKNQTILHIAKILTEYKYDIYHDSCLIFLDLTYQVAFLALLQQKEKLEENESEECFVAF